MTIKFNDLCWTEPWCYDRTFWHSVQWATGKTVIAIDRLWVLWQLANQAKHLGGEVWECGVYRGGSAYLLSTAIKDKEVKLRLFDTFTGIPCTGEKDNQHKIGDFHDTNIAMVRQLVKYDKTTFHEGVIPETFKGLEESKIAFCHVDVDMYDSVKACCEFVYPRLMVGGIMVFDDYDAPSCSGARLAVDEFFEGKPERPIIIKDKTTGSGVIFKSF